MMVLCNGNSGSMSGASQSGGKMIYSQFQILADAKIAI